MNNKVKLFYIVDLLIIFLTTIGMIIIENKAFYGLAALTSVGYFTILLIIFIISIVLLVVVSLIYFIRSRKKEIN